jgi:hypothetical protein
MTPVIGAELLGHARLQTTRVYTRPTAEDRSKAVDLLPVDEESGAARGPAKPECASGLGYCGFRAYLACTRSMALGRG